MENKLVKTNSLWYKIKQFFKCTFSKNKSNSKNTCKNSVEKLQNENIPSNNYLKDNLKKDEKNRSLAHMLLYGELGTSELDETEVDEMIEYFTQDIQNIDNELLRIKQHILYMQKELKN